MNDDMDSLQAPAEAAATACQQIPKARRLVAMVKRYDDNDWIVVMTPDGDWPPVFSNRVFSMSWVYIQMEVWADLAVKKNPSVMKYFCQI